MCSALSFATQHYSTQGGRDVCAGVYVYRCVYLCVQVHVYVQVYAGGVCICAYVYVCAGVFV